MDGYIYFDVEEELPLKQGLKLFINLNIKNSFSSWRGTSIKTRIETWCHKCNSAAIDGVEEELPLKQGLKLYII